MTSSAARECADREAANRESGGARRWRLQLAMAFAAVAMVVGAEVRAQTALPLPVDSPAVVLSTGAPAASFLIDAGTLPARARLATEVAPDLAHLDLEIEISVDCTWPTLFDSFCDPAGGSPQPFSTSVAYPPGSAAQDANFPGCNPASPFPGETCTVVVEALDFGTTGSPATVAVSIRAYTEVPSETQFVSVTMPAGQSGDVFPDVEDFIGEGQDFRWIYDDDDDDVVLTDVGGRCEDVSGGGGDAFLGIPYTYSFSGAPGFQGLDCCTWQIDAASGVVGAGQAIFFVGLDASDPANQPGDLDGDGIRDLCDNCPYTPNGPLLGTCFGGIDEGALCRSELECDASSDCSLSQEDDDFTIPGIACPEPGFGAGLLVGVGLLGLRGRRQREFRPRNCGRLAPGRATPEG